MSSPLQPLTSIKVKLGLLVTASALVAALVGALASSAAVPMLLAIPVTVALALCAMTPPSIGADNWPEQWVNLAVAVAIPLVLLRRWLTPERGDGPTVGPHV